MCLFQATIMRNAKDTAHTKAERNILECVKVSRLPSTRLLFSIHLLIVHVLYGVNLWLYNTEIYLVLVCVDPMT